MDAIERLRELAESRTHLPIRGPDARAILAHIETLRNGGERAQIVAYLKAQSDEERFSDAEYYRAEGREAAADAIASGAHMAGEGKE